MCVAIIHVLSISLVPIADVPAGAGDAQVDLRITGLKAFLAAVRARRDLPDLIKVRTWSRHEHPPLLIHR